MDSTAEKFHHINIMKTVHLESGYLMVETPDTPDDRSLVRDEPKGYPIANVVLDIEIPHRVYVAYFNDDDQKELEELMSIRVTDVVEEFLEMMMGMDLGNKFQPR